MMQQCSGRSNTLMFLHCPMNHYYNSVKNICILTPLFIRACTCSFNVWFSTKVKLNLFDGTVLSSQLCAHLRVKAHTVQKCFISIKMAFRKIIIIIIKVNNVHFYTNYLNKYREFGVLSANLQNNTLLLVKKCLIIILILDRKFAKYI